MMRTITLNIARYRRPVWRRAGFWQCAALVVALGPFAGWAWVRLSPPAALPVAQETGAPTPPRLHALERTAGPIDALASISERNLFTPSRTDWALAVAAAEERPDAEAERRLREERRKQAEAELERLTFVATIRTGDDWRALVDHGERRPGDDLLTLRRGDEFKSWSVGSITRDSMTLSFEGDRKEIGLGPRVPAGKPTTGPTLGRSSVEVRPAAGGVIVDPPISRDEAKRRLLKSVEPEDERLRRLVDELLDSMDKPRGAGPAQPAPPPAPPEKRT